MYVHPFFSIILQENLNEESRLKMAARNKLKQIEDEIEHLNQQVEDEEEAKNAFKNKLSQMTQQVLWMYNIQHMYSVWLYMYSVWLYMYSTCTVSVHL